MHLTLDQACDLLRQTLLVTLIVAAPMLLASLIVGTIVSIVQSLTQIQEQTLSLIPRIAATVAIAIALFPWMGQHVLEYAQQLFGGQI